MSGWVPSWAAVVELAVMAGVWFSIGSRVSAKALDRAYENGWDRCAAKVRARQAEHLAAGDTLALDDEGPYWREPEMNGDDVGRAVPELPERAIQPDAWQQRGNGTRELCQPGLHDLHRQDDASGDPAHAGGPAALNGSRLMNDQQVRAELAALADDVPRPEVPDEIPGSGPAAAPGHHHPLGWRDGVMLSDGLHWLADWRLDHQADAQAADEHIAAWVAESRAMLARASWQDRLLA